MIKYTLKHPIDGHVSLNIGMLPGHKRPSIWIDKYGVSQIIGSLKSESAARDLEQIIDFMLNPEEMIEPEPTEESIDNYDFARDGRHEEQPSVVDFFVEREKIEDRA